MGIKQTSGHYVIKALLLTQDFVKIWFLVLICEIIIILNTNIIFEVNSSFKFSLLLKFSFVLFSGPILRVSSGDMIEEDLYWLSRNDIFWKCDIEEEKQKCVVILSSIV
jgi:hypothetical protein